MMQALECARPYSMIGYVGVPHAVELDGQQFVTKSQTAQPLASDRTA
jgi:hypothetical protein